jgi:CheY-like chemotaxis protein
VEDNDDLRSLYTETLRAAGYRVEEMRNGADALRHLDRGARPKVILLDVMMPEMSGAELLEELLARPECDAIPVIAISGLVGDALGTAAYLQKPVSCEQLVRTVKKLAGPPPRRE